MRKLISHRLRNPNERAVERSHLRGVAEWDTGWMKAHHFFAVGLSKRAHLEYDADHDGFERRHGVRHAELVKRQWEALGVRPAPWMTKGIASKRAAWLNPVMTRVLPARGHESVENACG